MSKRDIENSLERLMEEISKKNFESKEDLNYFLKQMQGKKLDDLPKRKDNEGRSKDFVNQAYNQPVSRAKKLIKKALELDPNNVEAYNFLANTERDIDKAIYHYKKAIKAAEETLGKEYFKENKGYFWGLIETRPYMRAKSGLAGCYNIEGKIDKAIKIYRELLELNPNDNQGVRYMLSTLLLSKDDLSEFEKFIKSSEEEDNAVWNFNKALYSFKKYGHNAKSEKFLRDAHSKNKHVIDYMLNKKELPNTPPQYIGIGDENEAIAYVFDTWRVWEKTESALEWLVMFKLKRRKIN